MIVSESAAQPEGANIGRRETASGADVSPSGGNDSRAAGKTTSRLTWWLELVVIVTLVSVAVPSSVARAHLKVPADMVAGVGDPALLDRAIWIGVLVAVALSPIIAGGILGILSLMERRLCPASLPLPGRQRIGLFHSTFLVCVIIPSAVGIVFRGGIRPTGWLVASLSAVAAAVILGLYRGEWLKYQRGRIALVVAATLVLAVISNI